MRNENFSGVCLRCREAIRKCTAVIDFQVLLFFFSRYILWLGREAHALRVTAEVVPRVSRLT